MGHSKPLHMDDVRPMKQNIEKYHERRPKIAEQLCHIAVTLVVGENFFLMDVLWQWQVVVVFAADVCHIALQFRQYAIVVY